MNVETTDCGAVLDLLAARTGLSFPDSGRAGAELGVRRAMARAEMDDLSRFRDLLAAGALTVDGLVDELTIGETYFFREPEQFQFIREVMLPEVARRRGPAHEVRMWSAGCASGEEAYSLAMLCEDEGLAGRSFVLATDISEAALARAARADYGPWSLRGPGSQAAARHLMGDGPRRSVREHIRRAVTFAKLNLAGDAPAARGAWGMDLILCRNVLIYLDPKSIRRAAARLFESLAEGGWLITASTDPCLSNAAPFETVITPRGVFYRRPATPPRGAAPGPLRGRSVATQARRASPVATPTPPRPVAADEDAVRRIRAMADVDMRAAERACGEAIAGDRLSFELHHLRAVLLLGLSRPDEAALEARRALYLEPSSAAGHLLLGAILRRCGDPQGARRAYRNARDLCDRRPAGQLAPHADGEDVGGLAAAATAEMARLDREAEGVR